MNRKLNIIFAAAALVLAACTEHHIDPTPQMPESSSSYIFFEPEVIETISTRAASTETKELSEISETESFGVLGYYGNTVLFQDHNNHIAEVKPDNGIYSYNPLETWKSKDGNHTFYAFFPYSSLVNAVAVETMNGVNKGVPYIAYDIDSNIDVLTGKVVTSKGNGIAQMELGHALWALDIQVTNAQTQNVYEPNPEATTPRDPKLYVTSAKLTLYNIKESGKVYMNGAVVLDETATASKEFSLLTTDEDEIEIPHTTADNANVRTIQGILLLPATNSAFSYKLEMNFKNAWGVAYPVKFEGSIPSKTFEAGKRYKLAIRKDDGADFTISATLPVTPWDEKSMTHTFN